jgi:hypothetical protein
MDSGEPLTLGAFQAALGAVGLQLPDTDLPAALAGAQRLRAQVAELSAYLAALPDPGAT